MSTEPNIPDVVRNAIQYRIETLDEILDELQQDISRLNDRMNKAQDERDRLIEWAEEEDQ